MATLIHPISPPLHHLPQNDYGANVPFPSAFFPDAHNKNVIAANPSVLPLICFHSFILTITNSLLASLIPITSTDSFTTLHILESSQASKMSSVEIDPHASPTAMSMMHLSSIHPKPEPHIIDPRDTVVDRTRVLAAAQAVPV